MVRESIAMAASLTALQTAAAVYAFSEPVGQDVRHGLIRVTGVIPVTLWFAALIGFTPRLFWACGAVAMLLHVLIAFHLGHGWSHAVAVKHVEQSSGWGEGIFVSYVFTAIWLLDAAWWWYSPKSYRARPRWLHLSIHLFLAFIIFNATVVYGHGFARWLGVAMSLILTGQFIFKLR